MMGVCISNESSKRLPSTHASPQRSPLHIRPSVDYRKETIALETEQEHGVLNREDRSPCQIQREAILRGQTMSSDRLVFAVLTSPARADLCWVESREAPCIQFELLAGNDIVASLRFTDPPNSMATGQSASGAWVFEDEGLVIPRISVRSVPGGVPLAAYRAGFLGLAGHLEFFDGRRFCWRRVGLGTQACRFENAAGAPLIAVEIECCRSWLFGSRVIGGLVCIEPHSYVLSELMLLVLLSWYLSVLPGYCARFQVSP